MSDSPDDSEDYWRHSNNSKFPQKPQFLGKGCDFLGISPTRLPRRASCSPRPADRKKGNFRMPACKVQNRPQVIMELLYRLRKLNGCRLVFGTNETRIICHKTVPVVAPVTSRTQNDHGFVVGEFLSPGIRWAQNWKYLSISDERGPTFEKKCSVLFIFDQLTRDSMKKILHRTFTELHFRMLKLYLSFCLAVLWTKYIWTRYIFPNENGTKANENSTCMVLKLAKMTWTFFSRKLSPPKKFNLQE